MKPYHRFSLALVAVGLLGCVTSAGVENRNESAVSQGTTSIESLRAVSSTRTETLPDINSNGSVFQIRGNVARQVYQQLASVGQRSHEGDQEVVKYVNEVEILCTRSGGILPAGTRGFPPPVDYECHIRGNSIAKDGKPADQKEVVFLKNGAAKRFFGALVATPIQQDDRVSKSVKGSVAIVCKGAGAARDGAKCEAERMISH